MAITRPRVASRVGAACQTTANGVRSAQGLGHKDEGFAPRGRGRLNGRSRVGMGTIPNVTVRIGEVARITAITARKTVKPSTARHGRSVTAGGSGSSPYTAMI